MVTAMTTMRGECKTPGGKLVAVTVESGRAVAVGGTVDPPVESAAKAVTAPTAVDSPVSQPAVASAAGKTRVRIDGDFFIEAGSDAQADALLRDIERSLSRITASSAAPPDRMPPAAVATVVRDAIVRHPNAHLVGTDAAAIAAAYARAVISPPSAEVSTRGLAKRERVGAAATAPVTAPGESADFVARWSALWPRLDIVHDIPREPAEQMAVDERWAREVAAGTRPPTLRIWEWSAPCVVVGRFQSIRDEVHEDVARAEGITVVRRCTGGGAMFIEPGNTITYSLYVPLSFVAGLSVESSYRLCDRWLVEALRGLGLDVRFSGLNDLASQHGKIGGAAQRRFPAPRVQTREAARGNASASDVTCASGAVLHHVTMAYDIDAAKMARVLNVSREKMRDKAVRSVVKRVDPLKSQTGMTRAEVVAHLLDHCRTCRSRE